MLEQLSQIQEAEASLQTVQQENQRQAEKIAQLQVEEELLRQANADALRQAHEETLARAEEAARLAGAGRRTTSCGTRKGSKSVGRQG